MQKHYEFLGIVESYVSQNPDVAPYVAQFVERGQTVYISKLKEVKTNIEAALATILSRKTNRTDDFVKQKIIECGDLLSFRWDWYLKDKK